MTGETHWDVVTPKATNMPAWACRYMIGNMCHSMLPTACVCKGTQGAVVVGSFVCELRPCYVVVGLSATGHCI